MNRFDVMCSRLCEAGKEAPQSVAHFFVMARLCQSLYAVDAISYLASPGQTLNDELAMQVAVWDQFTANKILQAGLFNGRICDNLSITS